MLHLFSRSKTLNVKSLKRNAVGRSTAVGNGDGVSSGDGGAGFDLFRLSRSKAIVDLAPNTLRKYNRSGLNFYRRGKAVFISKMELRDFIISGTN